jgi:CRP-like cAMP-binding protein
VLGELGLLLRQPRSASVMVNRTASVYCLSDAALQQLKHERPDVAADFYEFLACFLSERVVNTTKSLHVLAD